MNWNKVVTDICMSRWLDWLKFTDDYPDTEQDGEGCASSDF